MKIEPRVSKYKAVIEHWKEKQNILNETADLFKVKHEK